KFSGMVNITNIVWGRDNTGDPDAGSTDRAVGTYTLQVTTAADPATTMAETSDPATGWVTIGTLSYQPGPLFIPHLRHRYDISANGAPIQATGLRIKVSSAQMAIDELEINVSPLTELQYSVMRIQPQPGYLITWDGNDGQFSGTNAPDNAALSSKGSVAIGSSQLDLGVHFIKNVNDGLYGNSQSWISGVDDPDPFIGVAFGKSLSITNLAWSRDNTTAPPYLDRWLGSYIVQVTTVTSPAADTPETEDPGTGWATVGTVQYINSIAGFFTGYNRHRFDVSKNGAPITATGLRIKVPNGSGYGGTDLDELEVNTPVPAPSVVLSIQLNGANATLSWTASGTLQSADDLSGPWTDVTNATNPMSVPIGATGQKFYRVRQ
ncbi:MAG: hypothetical protein M1608_03720, partial [Candidatus Omnitrophica bacterium]|nr:hypothetical protein [Candidatus Omnitrophota bacterium]